MQSLTTTTTGDLTDPSKLPAWDKVKKVYTDLKELLKREPTPEDDVKQLLKNDEQKLADWIAATGEDGNNANKYFAAAIMGQDFIQLYDEVNDMHMQCT
jgi:hypothetical protein